MTGLLIIGVIAFATLALLWALGLRGPFLTLAAAARVRTGPRNFISQSSANVTSAKRPSQRYPISRASG